MSHTARPLLHSARLQLHAPQPHLAEAVAQFYQRNQAHFAPWDPPAPPGYFDNSPVRLRLIDGAEAFDAGTAFRYWLCPQDRPGHVIGQVHVSQVARGPFQSAMLGYALDEHCQGQGLMHEALQAVIAEMFSASVWLHRLQANYRPENARSGKVLQALGFQQEGLARDYLFINGAWRDHVLTALHNPAWDKTQAPR